MEKEKILIFEPHPDDVAFQIAGSVVKWLTEGKEIMVCTITKGNNSTFDENVSSEEIEKVMAGEHSKAIQMLGLDEEHAIRWQYDDLGLDPGRDRLRLLEDMIRLIRKFKPATVISMDPKNAENEENPDHKLVAITALEASAMAAYPNAFREQFDEHGINQHCLFASGSRGKTGCARSHFLIASGSSSETGCARSHFLFASGLRGETGCSRSHFVGRMLYYMSPEPDIFIDISGESLAKKIKLGLIYSSQLDLMMTEAKERLKTLGATFPLFEMPKEDLWPIICTEIASDTADECLRKYPEKPVITHAESFRLQYLGIVDKIREFLPGDIQL
jgi:LmbE family N-acetylglucosaminyl deacetylase